MPRACRWCALESSACETNYHRLYQHTLGYTCTTHHRPIYNLCTHTLTRTGLDCYCSDEPSDTLPHCYWDDFTCSGDVCYIRRWLQEGVIFTKWGCLHRSNPTYNVDLICNGDWNRIDSNYTCCHSTKCNEHIEIVLPIELPTTGGVPSATTTAKEAAVTDEGRTTENSDRGGGSDDLPSSTHPAATEESSQPISPTAVSTPSPGTTAGINDVTISNQ